MSTATCERVAVGGGASADGAVLRRRPRRGTSTPTAYPSRPAGPRWRRRCRRRIRLTMATWLEAGHSAYSSGSLPGRRRSCPDPPPSSNVRSRRGCEDQKGGSIFITSFSTDIGAGGGSGHDRRRPGRDLRRTQHVHRRPARRHRDRRRPRHRRRHRAYGWPPTASPWRSSTSTRPRARTPWSAITAAGGRALAVGADVSDADAGRRPRSSGWPPSWARRPSWSTTPASSATTCCSR